VSIYNGFERTETISPNSSQPLIFPKIEATKEDKEETETKLEEEDQDDGTE
jgi:hypothetical protein